MSYKRFLCHHTKHFSLQNEKMLEIEMNAYFRSEGNLDGPNRLKTGPDNIDGIKQTGEEDNFARIMDYLKYYNEIDGFPLHNAVAKMSQF